MRAFKFVRLFYPGHDERDRKYIGIRGRIT